MTCVCVCAHHFASVCLPSHDRHTRSFVSTAYAIEPWTIAEQDEWIAHPAGDPLFADCIGIVDATYIRVERPKNTKMERLTYSTYKKYHALFFLAIIDRRGHTHTHSCALVCVRMCRCCSSPPHVYTCLFLFRPLSRCRHRQHTCRQQRTRSILTSMSLDALITPSPRRCRICIRQSLSLPLQGASAHR